MENVHIRRSAKARRLSLRVSRLDGRVTLTLPPAVSERQARAFLQEKSDWIARARASAEAPVNVGMGQTLPILGEEVSLVQGNRRSAQREGDLLYVPAKTTGRAVRIWLTEIARQRVWQQSDVLGKRIGRQPTKVTLRDTRSRWGSCSENGGIMLSWRLTLAPPDVFDYVIAHEIAHLKEMNHGPTFWQTVEFLMPEYDAPRRWLRTHGAELHKYRFD